MNILKIYRPRKYLFRILLSIVLLMAAFLIISSVLQYYAFRGTVLENQQETNKKALNQINYNIDYMSELIKTLALSIYFDSDTVSIMNSKTLEIYDLYPKLNRIDKVVNTTNFIHSIMIYNAHNGCYYSTSGTTSCTDDGMNQRMDQFLSGHDKLPKLKFVPMSLSETPAGISRVDLFSYFMYESTDNLYRKQSTFIVNLMPEWLFDNVNEINLLSEQADSSIIIMDGNGSILNPDSLRLLDGEFLSRSIKSRLIDSSPISDHFIIGAGASKAYITYMNSVENNWVIVNVQSYSSVFGKIDKMRTTSALMIASFLILSILASTVISLRLYKPIENILKQIKITSRRGLNYTFSDNDELGFISSEYKLATENMVLLQKNQEATAKIMKAYHLRKLVTDSSIGSLPEFRAELERSGLEVDLKQTMVLCVLKFDNYPYYNSNTDDYEKKLHKFAIANIAEEMISTKFSRNEIIDMRNDHFIVLLNMNEASFSIYADLTGLITEIQQNVFKYYRISLSAAISEPIPGSRDITKYYGQAMEFSFYRLVYGRMAVITKEMVRANQENMDLKFSAESERKLIEAIKSNDLKHTEDVLQSLMDYISKLNYSNMTYSIQHLNVIVNNAIREINNGNINQIAIDMQHFYTKIMEQDTLEGTRLMFADLFMEISEKRSNAGEDNKNYIIVDTIKEIIEENYTDMNLNLQGISTMMKMSSAHISKIYKYKENVSITDYITEVRLNHSLKLLENNNCSINEIMERVGFGNQSYFFKLFKKRFGTTPKEYRIKNLIR